LEYKRTGVMEYWNNGVMERENGVMEKEIGVLE
jgi:hypothetical protein